MEPDTGRVPVSERRQLVSLAPRVGVTATLYSYWITENAKKLVPNHFNLSIVKYDC